MSNLVHARANPASGGTNRSTWVEETTGQTLVIGAGGLLGGALLGRLRTEGEAVLGIVRPPGAGKGLLALDLAGDPRHWPLPDKVAVAYWCAGVTALDACRRDPEGSRQVNLRAPVVLARRIARRGGFMVFLSTNLVFDGRRPFPTAGTPVRPRCEYGRQKAAAERALLAGRESSAAVVRLTKVLHPHNPLLRGWLDALARGESITPFDDLPLAPVALSDTVEVLVAVARGRSGGIWQFSGDRDITYGRLGEHLARRSGADPRRVRPVTAAAGGIDLENLPRHSAMDGGRVQTELGIRPPHVWHTIDGLFFPKGAR